MQAHFYPGEQLRKKEKYVWLGERQRVVERENVPKPNACD